MQSGVQNGVLVVHRSQPPGIIYPGGEFSRWRGPADRWELPSGCYHRLPSKLVVWATHLQTAMRVHTVPPRAR